MQLKVTAGLAIGNFACNEEHTTQLMENKTSVTLIGLLKQHQNVNGGDLKLQHALLGTVRNLAVNPGARKQLLDQGEIISSSSSSSRSSSCYSNGRRKQLA